MPIYRQYLLTIVHPTHNPHPRYLFVVAPPPPIYLRAPPPPISFRSRPPPPPPDRSSCPPPISLRDPPPPPDLPSWSPPPPPDIFSVVNRPSPTLCMYAIIDKLSTYYSYDSMTCTVHSLACKHWRKF